MRGWQRLAAAALLAAATAGSARAQLSDDEQVPRGPSLPITQYAAALVFGTLAMAAVLRSSRRHWD